MSVFNKKIARVGGSFKAAVDMSNKLNQWRNLERFCKIMSLVFAVFTQFFGSWSFVCCLIHYLTAVMSATVIHIYESNWTIMTASSFTANEENSADAYRLFRFKKQCLELIFSAPASLASKQKEDVDLQTTYKRHPIRLLKNDAANTTKSITFCNVHNKASAKNLLTAILTASYVDRFRILNNFAILQLFVLALISKNSFIFLLPVITSFFQLFVSGYMIQRIWNILLREKNTRLFGNSFGELGLFGYSPPNVCAIFGIYRRRKKVTRRKKRVPVISVGLPKLDLGKRAQKSKQRLFVIPED